MFLYIFLFFLYLARAMETIKLNSTNNIILKGEVNSKMVSNFIYEINKKSNKSNIYVYLNTNGGSVHEGMKIVSEINKYGSTCIAERAYSMGFVILQACKERFILPHGSIMQHQISLGIINEKGKIDQYMNYIDQLEEEMTRLQSLRVGLSSEEFLAKTANEWWMYGEKAVIYRCADKVVNIECTKELTKKNYTEKRHGYTFVYSHCPLVSEEIDKKKNKDSEGYEIPIYFI